MINMANCTDVTVRFVSQKLRFFYFCHNSILLRFNFNVVLKNLNKSEDQNRNKLLKNTTNLTNSKINNDIYKLYTYELSISVLSLSTSTPQKTFHRCTELKSKTN